MNASTPPSERRLYALCAGLAAAVWLLPWLFLGRREAWDHSSYFLVSIPLMSLLAGYAAWRASARAWRWPLTLIAAQLGIALLLNGVGNLLPLGVVAFAVMGVPMMIAATIGARLGRSR